MIVANILYSEKDSMNFMHVSSEDPLLILRYLKNLLYNKISLNFVLTLINHHVTPYKYFRVITWHSNKIKKFNYRFSIKLVAPLF